MRADEKYIFPCHFVIKKGHEIFRNPEAGISGNTFILDTFQKKIYEINESIESFLMFFRRPSSFHLCTHTFGNDIQVKNFFEFAVEHNLLVEEEHLFHQLRQTSPCNPSLKPIFSEYTKIKSFKKKGAIRIDLVEDDKNEKFVIKYLGENKINRKRISLKQEIEIYKHLNRHPNLCKLIRYEEDVMIIDYARGKSLSKIIRHFKPTVDQRICIVKQIISIFAHLHQHNVIHGDVHLSQFIVDENFSVKLVDFGASYIDGPHEMEFHIIRTGVNFYFGPEEISKNCFSHLSHYIPKTESDVYRLGVLFYYVFYEKFPFHKKRWNELYHQIQYEEPIMYEKMKTGEKIPYYYITLMRRSLAKDVSKRFKSATHMMEFLNSIAN